MKKIKNIRVLAVLILLSFSACNVARNTPATNLPLAGDFRSVSDTGRSMAAVEWRSFFKDTLLHALIDTALVNNFDIQLALKNIESAQLIRKQARLGNLPEVAGGISAASNRPSDNSLNGLSAGQFLNTTHVEDYTTGISISWEADIWGKIRNRKAEAEAGFLQTVEVKKAVQTAIISSVAQEYYTLLMLDEQLRIARRNLDLNDSTLRIVRLQYQAGQVTQLAVQQAEARLLAAAQLIPLLEEQVVIRENALSVLTGNLPNRVKRNRTLQEDVFSVPFSVGVPAELLSYRPDIRNSEYALEAANARAGIAKASLYPSLSITAAGGVNAFQASNWFNIPASLFGTVAGNITQPIFLRRQLKTGYEIAVVEREKAVIGFRSAVLNAVGEVSDVLARIEKLKSRAGIIEERTSTLQKAVSNADLLFRNGQANYLEVITAQANVLQSELDLVSVRTASLKAGIELYRSLGGGWK